MAALGALTFFIMASACTQVDDRLGAGLVPRNQRMEIEVTSPASGVRTFLYRQDSVPSSRTGRAYFGRTLDADGVFGAQTSSALVQFLPISLPYPKAKGYGIDPIVDSAVIMMVIEGARGDTTVVQKFEVWDVVPGNEPRLHPDSTYYTNFPIEKYRGEKLFEFSHSGRRDIETRLLPTAAGRAYLDRIVGIKGDDWDAYTNDSLFFSKFHGLHIVPADDSPAAALYGVDLTQSGFSLHVRNHDTLDVSAIYDTLTTSFLFRDVDAPATSSSAAQNWNNVSVNMSEFDYSGSVLGTLEVQTGGFTDTLPTSTPLSTLYVQSMNGVGTYLRFTDDLIEEIRNLRFKIDEEGQRVGKDVAINQAIMKIWIEDNSIEGLDASMARLGSYLDLKTLLPVPDYQYAYEQNENLRRQQEAERNGTTAAPFTLPYGGYLNRSGGYYELAITSYIQQLSRMKEDDPDFMYISPAIFIGPEAYRVIGLGQSILKGFDSESPVSIRITYTIIEG